MRHRSFSLFVLALLVMPYAVMGQYRIIGEVLDAQSDEPVGYANIGIVELGMGTVSDAGGRFEITAPDEDQLVTITAIGYEPRFFLFNKHMT